MANFDAYQVSRLPFEKDEYFSGFGQRSLATFVARGIHVERSVDANGAVSYTMCRPRDLQRALQRSIRAGGGALGLCTEHLADSAPRVDISEATAEKLTLADARRLLRDKEGAGQ